MKVIPRLLGLMMLTAATAYGQNRPDALKAGFITPPDSVKPSVYWYWMSDNISATGVTKDLEAMAAAGIGRAFIGNIGMNKTETPYGNVKLFSDEWWKITQQAIRKAGRVGVDIGLFNSPGWSQSGGPWVKPEQAMRYLASTVQQVKGPGEVTVQLKAPAAFFQDVAVLAFPRPEEDDNVIAAHQPTLHSDITLTDIQRLTDNDTATAVSFPAKSLQIDITVKEDFTARSLVLYPASSPFTAQCELQVMHGAGYRTVKTFSIDRSNPEKHVGFMPYGPVAVSFPSATGRQFRLLFRSVRGKAGLSEIALHAGPRLPHYIEKQLAKMFQTPLPMWGEYQWPASTEPDNKKQVIDPSTVINLSSSLSKDGTLRWKAPPGNWLLIRYGMTPTGVNNSPAVPEGTGPEVDKMNKQALAAHFNAFVGKIQHSLPAADRKALKYVVADSYETGSQNWTDELAADFQKRYGYDPLPWLPVLTGRIVGSADQSDRFLWDLRRIIADRVAYDYVGGLRELSHRNGLRVWLENYGHWGFPGEFLQYGGQSDEIGGEFWNEGELGSIENKAASSAAHIYGKTKVSAESFTAGGLAYQRYPALLKKRGDWSFTEGINNTLLHVYIQQPYEERSPGVNAGFGTEFNRKNTWFRLGKAFIDYIRRCNFLLQQGKPVIDVAYFIGEDAPKMTGIRDPELPKGYSYDYINAEVIRQRLQVQDGRLVLPDGMQYRVLVLPPLKTMRPELLRRIKELVAAGATVLGPAPERSPSLQHYPSADREVKQLAAELWGKVDGTTVKSASYGKGKVLLGYTLQETLDLLKTEPDFQADKRLPVLYAHRATPSADIYFVTNQDTATLTFSPAFRISGRQPEWWDPVTGHTRALPVFTAQQHTTVVPLKLEAFQSGFVVFRNGSSAAVNQATENFPAARPLLEIKGPWGLQFDTAMRGPAQPVSWTSLQDWSKSSDEKIRDYSGTVIYRTSFNVNALPHGSRIYLNLGTVKVIAGVKVNGIPAGTSWTAPWQVDVTRIIKEGKNDLEIEVANTWVNRLIGDSRLPPDQRRTWTNVNIYTPNSPYEPSGLIGPVTLKAAAF